MATYGAFQIGPDGASFNLALVYDAGTLAITGAVVSNTTDEDQQFHVGDADQAAPVWTSEVVAPGTISETLDLTTPAGPGYSMISTPRGPRPVHCGNGPA